MDKLGRSLGVGGLLCILLAHSYSFGTPPETLEIFHTNDLHSQLRPVASTGLGGFSRLSTLLKALRGKAPQSLTLDGGDWSEGSLAYLDQGGRGVHRLLEKMGYDAAVVGNHDWLNGPERLLEALGPAPQIQHLSANINSDGLDPAQKVQFQTLIKPYQIKVLDGARVALIGLSTYEAIYDRYLEPAQLERPQSALKRVLQEIRGRVDYTIVVSHQKISANRDLLVRFPEVDLVIGAHDHKTLFEPLKIERKGGTEGWVVEAGFRGQHLGQIRLRRQPDTGRYLATQYRLHPVGPQIPADPEIEAEIRELEERIHARAGGALKTQLGSSRLVLDREGQESRMGNFVADAYREATSADLAMETIHFIYSPLPSGPLTFWDLWNAHPAVLDLKTQQSWALYTLPILGKRLEQVLGLIFSSRALAERGLLATSNLKLVYSPLVANSKRAVPVQKSLIEDNALTSDLEDEPVEALRAIEQIQIGGQPLDHKRLYTVAVSQGLVDTFEFMNRAFQNLIPLDRLKSTKTQAWTALANRLQRLKTLNLENTSNRGRFFTQNADLGVWKEEIQILKKPVRALQSPTRRSFDLKFPIHNIGASVFKKSQAATVRIEWSSDPGPHNSPSAWTVVGVSPLPAELPPGGIHWIQGSVTVPVPNASGQIRVSIQGHSEDQNLSNQEAVLPLQVD